MHASILKKANELNQEIEELKDKLKILNNVDVILLGKEDGYGEITRGTNCKLRIKFLEGEKSPSKSQLTILKFKAKLIRLIKSELDSKIKEFESL